MRRCSKTVSRGAFVEEDGVNVLRFHQLGRMESNFVNIFPFISNGLAIVDIQLLLLYFGSGQTFTGCVLACVCVCVRVCACVRDSIVCWSINKSTPSSWQMRLAGTMATVTKCSSSFLRSIPCFCPIHKHTMSVRNVSFIFAMQCIAHLLLRIMIESTVHYGKSTKECVWIKISEPNNTMIVQILSHRCF